MEKKHKLSESERLKIITEYEERFWKEGLLVAGMDEVGRGPLAGPVAAACVIMPKEPLLEGINDSKKLSEKKREILAPRIKELAVSFSIEFAPPELIDEINIAEATKLCFKRAFENIKAECSHVLVDYVSGLDISAEQIAIVHGDALSYTIGAASIIAKVERDAYMREAHKRYPEYNFAANKGYGTKEHIEALKRYGPCPLHRKSFIKNIIQL